MLVGWINALKHSMSRLGGHVKTNSRFGWNWGLQHLPKGSENGVEFGVVTLFHLRDLPAQVFVRGEHGAQLEESAHNRDVNLHGAIAMQDTGEHGDAVFRECVWVITATSVKRQTCRGLGHGSKILEVPIWNLKIRRIYNILYR